MDTKRIAHSVFGVLVVAVMLALPRTAAAQAVITTFPWNDIVPNICTGEQMSVTGQLTQTTQVSTSGFTFSFSLKGTGVGVSSATNYIVAETIKVSVRGLGAQDVTSNVLARFISKGSAANGEGHFLLHVTVNADGTITSFVEPFSGDLTCR